MVDILGHKKRALHEKAVMPLIKSLQDSDIEVQRDAADALGKIGDPRAIVPLGNKISESDVETRAVARHALHDVVDASAEDAVEPLVRLLQHNDPMVREEAATELGDLAQPVTEKVTETVSEAAGTAGEKLQPVAEKTKEVGEQAAEKASEAYETTKGKVQEAQREKPITERVKETASSVEERAHLTDEKKGEQVQPVYSQSSGDVLPATPEHDMDYHTVPEETRARQQRKKSTGESTMPVAPEHDVDYHGESAATQPPKEQGKKKSA
ncbi:MAG: HEAT repeat domain-containing protein [Halobacteriota archaeon]